MKALDGLSSSLAGLVESPAKCQQCGATGRLHQGTCVSCFLKDGLETKGEASLELFVNVLEEADVPDKQWHLGNYEILEEIGRGGMGVIYRARQRHSRRIVALKRVPTYYADSHEVLARFRREAEAAASLDHPNILPIYEVNETQEGLPFFTMKLAAGGSLRTAGPTLRTNPRECVRLLAKIARAIHYAHALGILHRDLQPGNILLDARGEPMVSDFGLAKWLDEESDLTRTLTTFGTPGYIAPESAEGGKFSSAADIYSLGAILFNLLTGRPPFVGATALAVIRQAAATPAPKLRLFAPALGRDLETIVARCLERNPKARYQTAGALADDLERWLDGRPIVAQPVSVPTRLWRWSRRNPTLAAAAAGCLLLGAAVVWLLREQFAPTQETRLPEKSIAVLPFENLVAESDSASFAHGIRVQIVARLAKITNLKVVSGSPTYRFQSTPENPAQVAAELRVANILEGSVEKQGEKFRIAVRLIDAKNNSDLWRQSYERTFSEIIQVESDVARHAAGALGVKLTEPESYAINKTATSNPRAYEAYLKGRYVWLQRKWDSYRQAKEYFDQAIALDPNYAQAYAGLADACQFLAGFDPHDRKANYDSAKSAYKRALELDPTLPEAHASAGLVAMNYDWDWPLAEQELRRAIALDPNAALFYDWYAEYLMAVGRVSESINNIERARELDPFSIIINTDLGKLLYFARLYAEAEAQLKQTLRMDPDFWQAHRYLGGVYTMKQRFDDAIAEFKMADANDARDAGLTVYAYGMAGRKTEAQQMLEAIKKLAARRGDLDKFPLALAYIGLGEKDQAITCLEQDYGTHADYMTSLKSSPEYDSLRSDSRFVDLMRRVHLAP